MSHKYAVGTIVLHEDGQYECEVLEQLPSDYPQNPSYKMRDCKDGTTFTEVESYLMDNE